MLLITGASGFLGNHIVDEMLAAGYEVKALVRNPEKRKFSWGSMVDIVEGDLLDVESLARAMEGVEYVIHAASIVSFWKKRHKEMRKANIEGTANLVNVCLDSDISKLIHVSSIGALGKDTKTQWIQEDTPWNASDASSVYAQTKYAQELEVYRGIAEGLEAVIVNPGLILGTTKNWEQNTGKLFSIVSKGLRYYNPGGTGVVGVKDVARAIRLVLERDIPTGERFVLVGENLTQRELLNKIAQAIDKTPPKKKVPGWASMVVGHLSHRISSFTGKEPVITPESIRSSLKNYLYNGSKICSHGFTYTPIDDVIQESAQAFLAQN
ncbi:MAG: NAD-dependent epimerase/dehydratase family protein [Bacteroidota bacterium]